MNYNKINNITGWVVFAIAMLVYLLTMSPTASFWDCGEFIACANELEVPHPPGAPFFLLIGRIFAMLSFGDVEMVSFWLNVQSVLTSAFTVLFTFWIITMLGKKIIANEEENTTQDKTVALMAAGVVGALACTFADSFWFNAVEAEVYAMSSFFTAIVVWLMLKWEARADQPGNQRLIILIAYLMGLSMGVHLLILLTIPAMAFIYYFKKYEFSWAGFIGAGLVSVAILGIIQTGIILWTFDLAWFFEKTFVGTLSAKGRVLDGFGLPIGTGMTVFFILLFGALGTAIWWSQKTKKLWLNTALLSTVVIYVGFASYIMIPIRSNANPPIDENNPENSLTYLSYMKREQYGNRPLFRGPLYNSRPIDYDTEKAYILEEGKDRYTESGFKMTPKYRDEDKKFFPRMYEPSRYNMGPHAYLNYVKNTGARDERGKDKTPYDDQPTAKEDMQYFFKYQINHMYIRYFMWNFAGKESDIQDSGWESGLKFWETKNMPDIIKNNRSKNHYYMLPFLLGLLGIFWQAKNRWQDATVIGMLFFFTGFAIILYLNQYPMQPRERDYSFAGSFQTFAIWIGLGVLALHELLSKVMKNGSSYVVGGLCLILVPGIMAKENWNDHSRHGRYVAPDSAYNLLNSLDKNAVLFTNGDNDTFPLWYIQEVENIRPDVRVLCLSYVNTDWYIDQMYMKMNESEPLPLTLKKKDYVGQENQARYFAKDKKTLKIPLRINESAMLQSNIINNQEVALLGGKTQYDWSVPTRSGGDRRYLELKDVLIVNLLQNVSKGNWERPVYFANTVAPSSFLGLQNNLRLEGLAYRIMPVTYPAVNDPFDPYKGSIDGERMRKSMMEVAKYRNLDNPDVYFDDNINRMVSNYHGVFYRLANHYLRQADAIEKAQNDTSAVPVELGTATPASLREQAKEVMMFTEEKFPYQIAKPEPYVIMRAGIMFDRLNMKDKAKTYMDDAYGQAKETLTYYAEEGKYFAKKETFMMAMQMKAQFDFTNGDQVGAQAVQKEITNLDKMFRRGKR